ncbi:MAG: hypothetical protein MI863_21505, partial [Desulfobacterales bacterium]|nr:hypothetical protein [Desulfobacterales bacterium]
RIRDIRAEGSPEDLRQTVAEIDNRLTALSNRVADLTARIEAVETAPEHLRAKEGEPSDKAQKHK